MEAPIMTSPTSTQIVQKNNFKHVNDHYGHPVGDQVLAATAAILTESLSAHDAVIGRLGGDEFAAIITAHDPDSASFIDVDLIEQATGQGVTVPHAGSTVQVSLSTGVAFLDGLAVRSLSYALAAADLAMYDAKPHNPGHRRLFHPCGETVTYHPASHGVPVLTDQPLHRVRHRDPA
jgi:diguanylate cyclase (GGDEF)-like protein